MGNILEKTRAINALLQQNNAVKLEATLPYNQISEVLSDVLDSNTYILNKEGILLGYFVKHDINNDRIKHMLETQRFPQSYMNNVSLLQVTKENIDVNDELTAFPVELRETLPNALTTVVPIFGAGERLGSIILGRIGQSFDNDDLVLAEYSATVVGMQILYQESRVIESEIRSATTVQMAINSLSYSELKAVKAIFDALEGDEGRLTASNIADKIGITRSVIVNALRKLESAGIIESRSLGMKGTYIRIINKRFIEQLEKETLV